MATVEHTARLAERAEVGRDLLQRHERSGSLFKRAVALFGVLFILGIVGFVMRLSDGIGDRAVWGYYAAVFAFILTTAQAAPMVAIATRLAKGHWRRPISRAAEIWTLVGLFNLVLFIPLLWILPDLSDGRRTLWFFDGDKVPSYSPHIWASAAILFLVITGRPYGTGQAAGGSDGRDGWRGAGTARRRSGTCSTTGRASWARSTS